MFHRMRLTAMLGAGAAMLAACAGPEAGGGPMRGASSPAATTAAAPAALAPAAPAPAAPAAAPGTAGTRFDGRYVGPADLTFSRGSVCGPQRVERSLVVQNGQARYAVDRNIVATGPVNPDGSLSLRAETSSTTSVTGRIEGGTFTGAFRSGQCGRSLSLRRTAG